MTSVRFYLTALGALLVSAASAQGPAPAAFRIISPIYDQLVTFSMPANFTVVAESNNGTNYIREAVLKGETGKSWTQMITVTGAKGLASNPNANLKLTPETFAGFIANGFKSACPDSFAAKGFGPTKFSEQDAYVAVASCGSVGADRHGETALIVAVKGRSDYYTVQWAERAGGDGKAGGKPAIDEARWLDRLRQLQPIRFCTRVPGESAPFPSCFAKT